MIHNRKTSKPVTEKSIDEGYNKIDNLMLKAWNTHLGNNSGLWLNYIWELQIDQPLETDVDHQKGFLLPPFKN